MKKRLILFPFLFIAATLNALEIPSPPAAKVDTPQTRLALIAMPNVEKAESWLPLIEQNPQVRLTLALSPSQLKALEPQRDRLLALRNAGRLDFALRAEHEAPLPIVYDLEIARQFLSSNLILPHLKIGWPQDVVNSIARARQEYKNFFGDDPKGFLPGGGSLSLPVAEFLASQKFQWTAAGFPEEEWEAGNALKLRPGSDDMWIYPAHPLSNLFYTSISTSAPRLLTQISRGAAEANRRGIVPVLVFDEARTVPSLQRFLTDAAKDSSLNFEPAAPIGSLLSREAVSTTLQVWPYSWEWLAPSSSNGKPGLSVWIGNREKNAAWEMLGRTREEVESYKNSGSANLTKLDRALEECAIAESADFFEAFGNPSTEPSFLMAKAEKEALFKASLANVYRHIELPVPDFLRGQKWAAPAVPLSSSAANASMPEPTTPVGLKFTAKSNSLSWELPELEPGAGLGENEVLKRFSVALAGQAEEKITISVSFWNDGSDPSELDTYIDINHREGAGRTMLLGGRNGRVAPLDGWEYVLVCQKLSAKAWDCKLYRASNLQPAFSALVQPTYSGGKNSLVTLEVALPRALLGRDPLRWGYLSCIMPQEGKPIIDFLAAVANKKSLLTLNNIGSSKSKAGPTDALLPMLRAESSQPY